MKMILESLNLQKVFPTFQEHRITYFDFLRLRGHHLLEMGLTEKTERDALLRVIKETNPSIFTEDPRPIELRRPNIT